MQVQGPEQRSIVHGALKKFGKEGCYKDKNKLVSKSDKVFGPNVKYWPYHVNDLKMAHCLLGKSNWTNEHGSNLLCM